jgi:hypothetical protein
VIEEIITEEKKASPNACVCFNCDKVIERIDEAMLTPDYNFICIHCWEEIPEEEDFYRFIDNLEEKYEKDVGSLNR